MFAETVQRDGELPRLQWENDADSLPRVARQSVCAPNGASGRPDTLHAVGAVERKVLGAAAVEARDRGVLEIERGSAEIAGGKGTPERGGKGSRIQRNVGVSGARLRPIARGE